MLRALRKIILLASLCPALVALSQTPYANDWTEGMQDWPWTKVWVSENGVHRINRTALLSQNPSFSNLSSSGLKLFHRGEEIPIYVHPSENGWAYLEFIGKQNDGGDDESIYNSFRDEFQATPYRSIFTDQASYFLTWSSSPGKRYTVYHDPVYTGKVPEPYVYISYDAEPDFTDYTPGGGGPYSTTYSLNSEYVAGEGYHIGKFSRNNPLEVSVALSGIYPLSFEEVVLEFGTFGSSQTSHIMRVESVFPDTIRILDTLWHPQDIYLSSFEKRIVEQTSFIHTYRFEALNEPSDEQSLRWLRIHYPRLLSTGNVGRLPISRWEKPIPGYLEIENFGPSQEIHAYYEKEPIMAVGTVQQNTGQVNLPGTQQRQEVWIAGNHGVYNPILVEPAFSQLCSASQEAEVLIITHPSLASSAMAYQNYREDQGYSTLLATTAEIYDEFGYGSRTPQAIRRFCACANENWSQPPRFVVLWGKAYQDERDHPNDKVPTFGYPASDWLYVMEDSQTPPFAAIGRVPVLTNLEGDQYLQKIQLYENQGENDKMKRALLLGGGISSQEKEQIGGALDRYTSYFTPDPWNAKQYLQKSELSLPPDSTYHQSISEGLGWIHFMGHPLQNAGDIELYEASAYSNDAQLPFILAMGDEGGKFTSDMGFGEKWILEQSKGAIAYLGPSAAGFLAQQEAYADNIYDNLFYDQNGAPIGIVIQETVRDIINTRSILSYRNQAIQFNLLGDPLIRLQVAPEITTSLEEQEDFIHHMNIYPNPAEQEFHLDFQLPQDTKELHIRLINILGEEVLRKTLRGTDGVATIHLPTPSNYLIKKGNIKQLGHSCFLDILIKNL